MRIGERQLAQFAPWKLCTCRDTGKMSADWPKVLHMCFPSAGANELGVLALLEG